MIFVTRRGLLSWNTVTPPTIPSLSYSATSRWNMCWNGHSLSVLLLLCFSDRASQLCRIAITQTYRPVQRSSGAARWPGWCRVAQNCFFQTFQIQICPGCLQDMVSNAQACMHSQSHTTNPSNQFLMTGLGLQTSVPAAGWPVSRPTGTLDHTASWQWHLCLLELAQE